MALGKPNVFLYLTAKVRGADRISDKIEMTQSENAEGRQGVIDVIDEFKRVFLATFDAAHPRQPGGQTLAEPQPATKADHVLDIHNSKLGVSDKIVEPEEESDGN